MKRAHYVVLSLLSISSAIFAQSESEDQPQESDRAAETNSGEWSFELTPYMWMAGVKTDATIGSLEGSSEVDFIDLLKKLEMGAMLHFEGHKDNWGFYVDGLYIRASDDAKVQTSGVKLGGIDVDGELEQTIVGGGLFYRIGEDDRHVDLLAGVRYMLVDIDINAKPLFDISKHKDWVDPVVGARFQTALSPKWTASVKGDIGGFGVGSELTWQVTAFLGYKMSDSNTLAIGYRHLEVDYDKGDFTYDASFSGPFIGLSFHF